MCVPVSIGFGKTALVPARIEYSARQMCVHQRKHTATTCGISVAGTWFPSEESATDPGPWMDHRARDCPLESDGSGENAVSRETVEALHTGLWKNPPGPSAYVHTLQWQHQGYHEEPHKPTQLALRRWPNVGIGRHRRDRQPTLRQRWYSVACVATVVGILSERDGWRIVVCRCFVSGHRWLESSVSRINVVVQPDYRYINYIFKHQDQKNYYTSNLNKMYHFAASILFYDIAQLRFPPKAIWVQQVVSTVFPSAWLRKIRQCFFAFRQLYRRFF